MRRVLDRVSRRTNVTAANLANVDTPGYKALEVKFGDTLAGAVELRRTDPRHLSTSGAPQGMGKVVEAVTGRIRNDGNTVDVDMEMTNLAKLQGRYSAAAKMLSKRFALLQYAVSSRGQG
ncbi:hypothetical protein ABI59_14475 [Acidobacteria bacterium Mor1]|nr:hypothetical protein ABI59_14475 [Acidobacteria bacterium Mor1]